MTLGVAFGGHVHPFEDLLALVRRAEALGYRAAYVDGDVSVVPSRGEGDVLDGWTATVAICLRTERIEVGSLRVAHQWNAARLAQAAATLERIAPGRLRFLISIGGQPADRRFGFPALGAGTRIEILDETLAAIRRLWAGESVDFEGRHVRLRSARVRPCPPPGRPPIEIAARRPRMLRLVARHARRWEMNLPPVRRRVREAEAALERACEAEGRDPKEIGRSMWIFARLGDRRDAKLREEYRRLNPWFGDLAEAELDEAIAAGSPEALRERLGELQHAHRLELPVLDLSSLPRAASERILEACAPGEEKPR